MLRLLGRALSRDSTAARLERLERLQALTAALAAADAPEDVARIILTQGFALVAARGIALHWERAAGELELVHAFGVSEPFADRWRRASAREAFPMGEAYRTGEPVFVGTRAALAARFPRFAEEARQDGVVACAAIPLAAGGSRGGIGLLFDSERPFDEDERAAILAVARACAQAFDRARLHAAQARLAERLAAIQRVTSECSAALTPAEVAAVVFRGLAGLGVATAGIFYRTVPDRLDLLFDLGFDEGARRRSARASIDEASPPTDAARTGEVVWLDSADAIRARYPDLASREAAGRAGGWVAVPLEFEGRPVGALSFSATEGVRLDASDRSFVLALAQQCALALERARLFEAEKRLADRLSQLQATSAALSGAATAQEVAEHVFRAVAALGASASELHVIAGDRIALVARRGAGEARASWALDAPVPAAEVVRTGRALWLESPEEIAARYPHLEPERAARGEGAWGVVPLLAGGRPVGALSLAFPAARRLDADERSLVRTLSQPCALALERARLLEASVAGRAEAVQRVALLEAAFAAAPFALALLDRELRFVRVNRALADHHGVPAEAHAGRTVEQVLPGVAGEQIAASARRILGGGEAAARVEIVGETPAAPGSTRRWVVDLFAVRVGGETDAIGMVVEPAAPRRE